LEIIAIVSQPKIFFTDEPTGSLNSLQGEHVLDLLTQWVSEGLTFIMATHDIKAAARADRVLFIKDGKIQTTRSRI